MKYRLMKEHQQCPQCQGLATLTDAKDDGWGVLDCQNCGNRQVVRVKYELRYR